MRVLSLPVDPVDCQTAAGLVVEWANNRESRVVCAANVHMVMEARDSDDLLERLETADLTVPDGTPLVWALRALGEDARHVRGTDLTREVCRLAQEVGVPIGLYGSTPETLTALEDALHADYPSLQIALAVSPPFRPLTAEEDDEMTKAIQASGARVLLVGLGCPKQELWMIEHRGRFDCVMLGVGAAFEFLAGTAQEAPVWMQRLGLEWLHRLASEPRRLWRRYLKHNPRFVALFAFQWLKHVFRRR